MEFCRLGARTTTRARCAVVQPEKTNATAREEAARTNRTAGGLIGFGVNRQARFDIPVDELVLGLVLVLENQGMIEDEDESKIRAVKKALRQKIMHPF